MADARVMRLMFHVGAIAGAISAWWMFADFAAVLVASTVLFAAISALGWWLHGPLPTEDDLRRDVEEILQRAGRTPPG